MKTNFLLLLTCFLLLSCGYSKQPIPTDDNATVLICTGLHSHRYHSHFCRGMKACKGETREVTLLEAKEMGLTPCGYCYKTNRKHNPHYYDDWDD